MTPEQKRLVQASFEKVVPISELAAELFYNRLFELDSNLKPLFKSDIKAQGYKLMKMIGLAVKDLNSPEILMPILAELGKNHVEYGIKDEDYDTVGTALIWTLEKGLGDDFTPEVKAAWIECYGLITTVMKGSAVVTITA